MIVSFLQVDTSHI